MDQATRRSHGHDQALASDTFDKFCNSGSLKDILTLYRQLCSVCKLVPTNFQDFFPKIRGKIPSWRAEELWTRFEKKAAEKCYARGRYCANTKILIIGAGPCGLRAAIDAQLLGAKVVVIEKRDKLSRNNVLHLWPFVITDLRALGAKVLYGKFCAGSIDHISIRQIQCILLKVALLLGVEFYEGVSFQGLKEPGSSALDDGWRAQLGPPNHPLSQYQFDVVLGADGRRSILSSEGFKTKALRAKLAIAITANFINKHTEAEAKVEEISGVSYIFRQQFFQDLDDTMGIALENIVYYKDETHYFVMTPKKQSLLEKGVLYQDFPEPELLLSPENVDQEALQRFTMEAIVFATDNRLPELEFALDHHDQPDVAVFDFTEMYQAENACRAIQRKGHKLLMGLVGDALLQPWWPSGSGCARGFLGSYDAIWMLRQWGKGLNSVLEVLAERESIYRLLAQTTPENLSKDHNQYSIDPRTRYPKINLSAVNVHQIPYLFDSDVPIQDVFDPIRDPNCKARKEFVMSEDFLVHWIQEQLQPKGLQAGIGNICEIFNGATALPALLHRYRPDLIDFPLPDKMNHSSRNQLALDILHDEFDLHLPMDGDKSVRCTESDRSVLIRYLSLVYLRFKGDIPRDNIYNAALSQVSQNKTQHCPNNSKLHHSLSIKEFLRAKELLEKNKKDQDENNQSRREKRRSQFYDALMQSENQNNGSVGGALQKSQTTINVVIPVVKLNPVPPGELFAACRHGREKDVATEIRPASVASSAPHSKSSLTRSRSDVGFRRGPSPLASGMPPTASGVVRSRSNNNNHDNDSGQPSEAVEMQMRIMKRRATPAGAIISTFMQKQAVANLTANVEHPQEQENWTRRQIRDMRARSLNNNTFNGWGKRPDTSHGNHVINNHSNNQINNSNLQQAATPGPDVSFKDRCKFLERNIYNSGRDFKVHYPTSSAPWFSDAARATRPENTSPPRASPQPPPTPTPTTRLGPVAIQKSPSTAAPTGSTCFMASKKLQQSQPPFVNKMAQESLGSFQEIVKNHQNFQSHIPRMPSFQQQLQQKQQQLQSIEKKLGNTISAIKNQLVNPPQYQINGQIIHPGTNNNNNTNHNNNTNNADKNNNNTLSRTTNGSSSPRMPRPQQPPAVPLRRSQTSVGVHNHHHHHPSLKNKKVANGRPSTDSSGESDNDTDFLKGIDFETIDGQELQELLSSF